MPLAQAKVFYYDFVEIKPWTYEFLSTIQALVLHFKIKLLK